jgi:PAS domain S-box-containing protein
VQQSSDLIFVIDAHGVIQFASTSSSRIIGYEPASLVGVALPALSDPEDVGARERVRRDGGATARRLALAEWRLRRPGRAFVVVEAIAATCSPTRRSVASC